MTSLSRQRCRNHSERQAAVRCPSCGRFFCRECTTEHDGRLVCSGCLGGTHRGALWAGARRSALLFEAVMLAAGVAAIWAFFGSVGEALTRIPSSFHQTGLHAERGGP